MTTHAPPTTLAAFLLARADEDEAVALADLAQRNAEAVAERWAFGVSYTVVGARHDPARVLAEVAAKRAVVELHAPGMTSTWGTCHCVTCQSCCETDFSRDTWPCPTLLALAQPYAAHPEFDPGWRA